MLYFWWIYSLMGPLVVLDFMRWLSPLHVAHWPLGLEYLSQDS